MGRGSRLKIEIVHEGDNNKTGGQSPKGPAPSGGRGDEGYIDRLYRPDDLLVPPKRSTVKYFDIGTRLVNERPYSYREVEFYRPMQYDWPIRDVTARQVEELAEVAYTPPAGAWAEWEGLIMAGEPFGETKIGGRNFPNVLQLNHMSVFGQAVADFYDLTAPVGQRGPFPLYDPDSEENWKWVPVEIDPANWSEDATEWDLAPNTGQYVMQKKRDYNAFYTYDPRYKDFWMGNRPSSFYKMTESPSYSAPAVTPKLTYPLRIFGIPYLWYPYEMIGVTVNQYGQPGEGPGSPPDAAGFAVAVCTIQEFYVSHLMRAPQIPMPYVGSVEDWLTHVPEQYVGLTIKRKAWKADGVANYYTPGNMPYITNVAPTETWEVFSGRRPRPLEEIEAEAQAQAMSDVLKPTWGPTQFFPSEQSLAFVQTRPPVGRLIGLAEMKKKVYYVWQAL